LQFVSHIVFPATITSLFILTEKTLLSEQGQSSLAMPGNKTRELGVLARPGASGIEATVAVVIFPKQELYK